MPDSPDILAYRKPKRLRLIGLVLVGVAVAVAAIGLATRFVDSRDTKTWTDEQAIVPVQLITLKGASGGDFTLPVVKAVESSMPSVVALPHQCDRVWRSLRSKKEKTVWNADGSLWMHFDLEKDPGESGNQLENTALENPESGIQN